MPWQITPTKDRRFETAVPCWMVHLDRNDADLQGITCWNEEQANLVAKALNNAPKLLEAGQTLLAAAGNIPGWLLTDDAAQTLDDAVDGWIEAADPCWTCESDDNGEIVNPYNCPHPFNPGSEQCDYCCNAAECQDYNQTRAES